jgi:hypothetical protein
MKAKILVVLVVLLFLMNADAGDKYPSITTLDGETYNNVEVASHSDSYLILLFDGGGKKVWFTNLPPDIQTKYHFDAVAAAKAQQIADEKRAKANIAGQAALAQAQKAAAWTGPSTRIRIIKNLTANNYEIATHDFGHMVVCIPSLPYERRTFIEKINALRSALANLLSPQERAHVSNASLVLMDQEINDKRQQLNQMQSLEARMVNIMAGETRQSYVGTPVWRFTGQAPIVPFIP